MFVDNSLSFQTGGWTSGQAVSSTAAGTNIIDITGAGSGNAPGQINGAGAANTAIGADYGQGDGMSIPYLYVAVTVAGTGTGTITISLAAAPDNGSYSPGTYTTILTTPAFTGSTLTLGSYYIAQVPPTLFNIPGSYKGQALPRFYKLTYTVASTAGATFVAGFVTNPPSALQGNAYNLNYIVV